MRGVYFTNRSALSCILATTRVMVIKLGTLVVLRSDINQNFFLGKTTVSSFMPIRLVIAEIQDSTVIYRSVKYTLVTWFINFYCLAPLQYQVKSSFKLLRSEGGNTPIIGTHDTVIYWLICEIHTDHVTKAVVMVQFPILANRNVGKSIKIAHFYLLHFT